MQGAMLIPRPGVRYGPYPERSGQDACWSFYPAQLARAMLFAARPPSARSRKRFIDSVHAHRAALAHCNAEFVAAAIARLRAQLLRGGMTQESIAEAFALIEVCMRAYFKIELYDPQLLAAWLLLDRRLVEMQTGEGKTFAVALAAMTAALAGIPVHVVTANDYLVERDAAALEPVCKMLGLSVSAVLSKTPGSERPLLYRANIVYCTAKELAFDYLRDHLAMSSDAGMRNPASLNLRGLCMAIVDEADSVLIDEARMPLILSAGAPDGQTPAFYRQALFLASQMKEGTDYALDHARQSATLTPEGRRRAEFLCAHWDGPWRMRQRREETLCLALAAQHLFLKGRHYLVRDNQLVIVDETSGRAADGRAWAQGLHQLIETKEGCALTQAQRTVAQTTFQRFFRRYLRLSGISGTAMETRHELLAVYGLPVVEVPLRFHSKRRVLRSRVFGNEGVQWRYIVKATQELHASGRPVLIGTDCIEDSESLSALLKQAGIQHSVLNARFDADEACIIAEAGRKGAVTVSTNMAGRGTDIRLGEGLDELGGLHVMACQSNDSRRIDRQLYGRCARQGEAGSVQHVYRLGASFHPLPEAWLRIFYGVAGAGAENRDELPWQFALLARCAQFLRARRRQQERWALLLRQQHMDAQLAFAGVSE